MEQMYTNWNAGLTKDGSRKTYEFLCDRRSTVAYTNIEQLIDEALTAGYFDYVDNLYIKVIDMTCRHLGHSGPNGHPSKKDRCAVPKKVIDKKKTKEAVAKFNQQKASKVKKPKPVYKTLYECKRRKPQPVRAQSGIYRDPYNRKLKQFSTASNDGLLNGGDPFTVLFNLHNVDDKAIAPAWLTKPPSIKWSINTEGNVLSGDLVLHLDIQGEQAGEYAVK